MLGCKTLKPKKACWVAISLTKADGSLMSLALLRTEDSKNVEDCKYCVLQHLGFEAKKVIGKQGFWYSSWGNGTKKVTSKPKKVTTN